MNLWTRRGLVLTSVLAAFLVAGCGSSGGSSATPAGNLMQALGAVRDSPYARADFAWSDLRTIRRVVGYPAHAAGFYKPNVNLRWEDAYAIAAGDLAPDEPILTRKTNIDVFAADSTIQIGVPPNVAVRLEGPSVNTAAISQSLRALGAKQQSAGGRTFLAMGAQHSININGPLAAAQIVTNQLDRSVAQGQTFATGSAVAPVTALLGGSPTLATDPGDRTAAGCLGDVVTAEIFNPAFEGAVGSPAELAAIGDRRPTRASAPVTEVLCAIDATSSSAGQEISRIMGALGSSGRVPDLGRARLFVGSLTVSQSKHNGFTVVRAVINLQPNQQAGLLDRILIEGDIGALVGGATRLGP